MRKLLSLLVGGAALVSFATPAGATGNDIPGVDIDFDHAWTKTELTFCVKVDQTDDGIDNPLYRELKSKLVTKSDTLTVMLDEDDFFGGMDLNEDGDELDEFQVTYVQYEQWLKTSGEGSSLTVQILSDSGVPAGSAIIELPEWIPFVDETLQDTSESHGLTLTDNECQPGPQGPAGSNGTNGTDGKDGESGKDGAQGPAGPPGEVRTIIVHEQAPAASSSPVAASAASTPQGSAPVAAQAASSSGDLPKTGGSLGLAVYGMIAIALGAASLGGSKALALVRR